MMDRVAGGALSLVLAAAGAKAAEPLFFNRFGFLFEVPVMIAGLFGCIVTRVIIGQSGQVSRWLVRVPVDVLTVGTTFFLIASVHPAMLTGLMLGIAIASLGASIINIAEARGRKLLDALLPGESEPPHSAPPADPDSAAGIGAAMRDLNKID